VPRTKNNFAPEQFFQALGDQTRLRLLNLMGDQELCVCYFVEVLNQPQPKISRHLAYLRRAGVVSSRREGKWIHYRIEQPTNPEAQELLSNVLAWLAADKSMQADRARLVRACCAPSKCSLIREAPQPTFVRVTPKDRKNAR
jgi:ArsR family transcriptional regulator